MSMNSDSIDLKRQIGQMSSQLIEVISIRKLNFKYLDIDILNAHA